MPPSESVPSLRARLAFIYADRADEALAAIDRQFADLSPRISTDSSTWTERDVVLITYADQLRDSQHHNSERSVPLAALRTWLLDSGLAGKINTVHLLPFCPYSSDDGFSVIDYLAVDPDAGDWDDIAAIGKDFGLMFDLVLNHISQHSEWFQAYQRGEAPFEQFFVEANPSDDYSAVVRPRSLPLLTPVDVMGETRHVWTTFSEDQIDLNYAEPVVLARMLRILVEYALRGARIVRLDAVAFLWKELGTNCLHLPQTHELVKLMRDVVAAYAPGTLLLTETNVPHAENISYFGGTAAPSTVGDEAHMVYQFSLPPLLLEAFLSGDATAIRDWLTNLAPPPDGCTFFNFTASHDGVGVRPLEGLVSPERFDRLIESVRERGARINMRRNPDGSESPYELCLTYYSALAPKQSDDDLHVRRFLASQAVMLALQGMPAVYFHSLVATPNDTAGADNSGIHRRINRRKYERQELDTILADTAGTQRRVFDGYRNLLTKRIATPAFHPEDSQQVIQQPSTSVLTFERSTDAGHRVLVAVNFAEEEQSVPLPEAYRHGVLDLITEQTAPPSDSISLAAGQAIWLVANLE